MPEESGLLCGVCAPDDNLMGVGYYLEMRKDGFDVGPVCQGCKALAMPLAKNIIVDMAQNMEDDGLLGDAEDWRRLADTLARETDQDDSWG